MLGLVRKWVMHYVLESPHEGRSTRMCVFVCVCAHTCDKTCTVPWWCFWHSMDHNEVIWIAVIRKPALVHRVYVGSREGEKKASYLLQYLLGFCIWLCAHASVHSTHCPLVYGSLCESFSLCMVTWSLMLMRTLGKKLVKSRNNGCHPAGRLRRISSVRFSFSMICK